MSKLFDVVVVGAGFAGLYQLKRLRDLGFSVIAVEAGSGIGGTWFWNRYPGLRCDVESMTYSYSFDDEIQREWNWSQRYAEQSEILRYINYVADKFDLKKDVELNSRITRAVFDEDTNCWSLSTEKGNEYLGRVCVLATGCLSVPNTPTFPGLQSFEGEWYHTGAWPTEQVDFSRKRVGVVGTGSSGVQCIPIVAETAKHLTVFQRTPNFSIPAWNRPLSKSEIDTWKSNHSLLRKKARESPVGDVFDPPTRSALSVSEEERTAEYERRWLDGSFGFLSAFNDLLRIEDANSTAADFFRRKIRERVKDAAVASLLSPTEHLGTKRLCVDTNYFETFNRPNVHLVDLRTEPIVEILATGIKTHTAFHALDLIVFATGYDAMTGALTRMNIHGRDGISLNKEWEHGPHTYLGLAMPGFPNLFTVTGPQSPSVVTNMMVSIEQHVEWIADCISWMRTHDVLTIEATKEAEAEWMDHATETANATLFPQANSWYLGSNIEGKARVCMPYVGGAGAYRKICAGVAADGYRGFRIGKDEAQRLRRARER